MDKDKRKRLLYKLYYKGLNTIAVLTLTSLTYFASVGIFSTFKLPKTFYLFNTILIESDIMVFLIMFLATLITYKLIKIDAEERAVELWFELIRKKEKILEDNF